MKKIKLMFLSLLIATTSFGYQANVTKVISGDTFMAKKDNQEIKVRVLGIDAPELKQNYGKDAKKYLESLILNKTVEIKEDRIDQYDRVVGEVFLGDKNINIDMLETGNAWCMRSQREVKEYFDAQEEAKANKKGLWAEENPESPWKFRANN